MQQSKYQPLIDDIKQQFAGGAWIVEIKTERASSVRNSLYNLARRRGLNWTFTVWPDRVFVVRSSRPTL